MPWTLTATPPKWSKHHQLLTAVPWLADSDFDEDRRVMWEYDSPYIERVSCWPVKTYEQQSTGSMYLLLHATRGNGNDGGIITLAISDTPHFDLYARECFAQQSNPHRRFLDAD